MYANWPHDIPPEAEDRRLQNCPMVVLEVGWCPTEIFVICGKDIPTTNNHDFCNRRRDLQDGESRLQIIVSCFGKEGLFIACDFWVVNLLDEMLELGFRPMVSNGVSVESILFIANFT